jgi:hypothetical protein
MNHTAIIILAIAVGALALIVIIPGYLQEIKAEAKTYSLSTSMSTSCNGDTDEPCQTVVCKNDKPCRTVESNSDQTDITIMCKDNKPCRTVDSNSSPPQQTENMTPAEQQQQPDSSSNDAIPPPRIPDHSGDEIDYCPSCL